jgi:Fe-S-cluster containining protein
MADKVKVEFELQMGQEGVRVALNVPTAPMPVRKMLPLFQGLTHQIIDVAVARAAGAGETVSCKAGCGACCRYLVPISKTEARQIRAVVDAMPEPRRTEVRARFADAVARLEAAGLLEDLRRFDALPEEQFLALNPRYLVLRIPCPFLEDESCSIHPQRPLICREYLVTSPPERCGDDWPVVDRIALDATMSQAVAKLESTDPRDSRLALVLALEWTDAHAGDEQALRPAVEWIDQMLEGMTGKALRGVPEPAR